MVQTKRSSFTLALGLLVLFGSQGYNLLLPQVMRLGLLAIGLILILWSCFARWRLAGRRVRRGMLVAAFGFSALLMQEANRFLDASEVTTLVFVLVAFALFMGGMVLGASTSNFEFKVSTVPAIVLAIAVGPSLIALLTSADKILSTSLYVARDFGDDNVNANGVAYTSAILTIILFYITLNASTIISKALGACCLFLSFATVIYTGSRGAPLFLICSGALTFILTRGNSARRQSYAGRLTSTRVIGNALIVLISGACLMALINPEMFESRVEYLWGRFLSLGEHVAGSPDSDRSMVEREVLQAYYVDNFSAWFPFGMSTYGEYQYPHNQFIEWLARFGVTGLVIAITLALVLLKTCYFLWKLSQVCRIPSEVMLFFGLCVFCYLQSLSSMSLEMNRGLFISLGYLTGLLSYNRCLVALDSRRNTLDK